MIDRSTIESALDKADDYIVLSVDQEISYYRVGSIRRGRHIRVKISYLEFYYFALTELLLFYDAGLDYNDYEITDEQVELYISYIDEIITVLFEQNGI